MTRRIRRKAVGVALVVLAFAAWMDGGYSIWYFASHGTGDTVAIPVLIFLTPILLYYGIRILHNSNEE